MIEVFTDHFFFLQFWARFLDCSGFREQWKRIKKNLALDYAIMQRFCTRSFDLLWPMTRSASHTHLRSDQVIISRSTRTPSCSYVQYTYAIHQKKNIYVWKIKNKIIKWRKAFQCGCGVRFGFHPGFVSYFLDSTFLLSYFFIFHT